MKITICGSSAFRKEMLQFRDRLKEIGHEPILHPVYDELVSGRVPELARRIETEHGDVKKQYGFIKWYYNSIVNSDAILVLNFEKNGIKNYIGGNTLMEMAFAHVHDKKVFLLNPLPEKVSYVDEIKAMVDVVLNGDLKKIK
jgi:hypothetical protein